MDTLHFLACFSDTAGPVLFSPASFASPVVSIFLDGSEPGLVFRPGGFFLKAVLLLLLTLLVPRLSAFPVPLLK